MRYERDLKQLQLMEDTVLSLGKFDGLHCGHGLLLESVSEKAKQGLKAAVFTFDIPPVSRTAADGGNQQVITTNEEKRRLLEERGVDVLVECPFTPEIMRMEAETFIREIATRLRVKWMVVGTDFRFGHNRRGDYHMLEEYAGIYGYRLQVVPKMQYEGRDISSTYIREEITKGNMGLAAKLLGYPYFIEGTICHGNRLGRQLGFPTINQEPAPCKILPPFGVYSSIVELDDRQYGGITNIGKKPTIHGSNPVGVETYIYDFDADVYGRNARVSLLRFARPEKEFSGIGALQAQLREDIRKGREYLKQAQALRGCP